MDNTREKLMELLEVDLSGSDGYEPELIADYLLANGVTLGSKWIPVTERLPVDEELVLILCKMVLCSLVTVVSNITTMNADGESKQL